MTTNNEERADAPSSAGMSLERFAALAETYGADIDRWPEADRFAALSLAGRSEEARNLLADAHGLDFLLSRLDTPPEPSPGLRERMASLGARGGRTVRPGLDVLDSVDQFGASSVSAERAGLLSAVRANALMLSIVANLVLAGAVGGLWIASPSVPGTAPAMAYGYVEFEEALSEELGDDLVLDGEADRLAAVGDFEFASWPEADRPSDDEVSAI